MLDYLAQLARHGRIDPLEFYVSEAHRAVYVENAKVACTAIKAAMFPAQFAQSAGQDAFHEDLRAGAFHRLPANASDYFVFTFVRHPLARLQSCYRDKVRGEGAAGAASGESRSILHRRFHRSIFAAWGGVDIRDDKLPFDRFAKAVSSIPDRISDRHFASQIRMVEAVENAADHFVGRMERLEDDWEQVRARTGLPALVRANRTRSGHDQTAPDAATLRLISRRYARDFAALGYER